VHPGKLGDIAPTLLKLMGYEVPPEMTGEVLFD
jgi:2,3-bisphosphoglycerate-independent phosphoglycerate mutase